MLCYFQDRLDEFNNIKTLKYILGVSNDALINSDNFSDKVLKELQKGGLREKFMEQIVLRTEQKNKSINVFYYDSTILIKWHFIEHDKDVLIKIQINIDSNHNPIKVFATVDAQDTPDAEIINFTPTPAEKVTQSKAEK